MSTKLSGDGSDGTISIQTYAGKSQPLTKAFADRAADYNGTHRESDMWIQHAADFVLLDAIIHNVDRHQGNYLLGDLSAGNEEVPMPFPIDMAKPFGKFDPTNFLVEASWGDVKKANSKRFRDLGRTSLEQIASMSTQQAVQYLQRFISGHPDGALLRNMAEVMIRRAQSAPANARTVYGI
jgi:hypothetical protein